MIDTELHEKYFKDDNIENFVNIDIAVFKGFKKLRDSGCFESNKHVTFAFSYYCLISYLWKYAKYGKQEFNANDIKSILGISKTNRKYDYIFKKGGVLDDKRLTETTRDFPISVTFDNYKNIIINTLSMLEDEAIAKDFLKNYNNRYTCKKPLHQIKRKTKDGLLYSNNDAMKVTILEFTRFLLDKEFGMDVFYLYLFIKLKFKVIKKDEMNILMSELEEQLGFERKKIREMMGKLKDIGILDIRTEQEVSDNGVAIKKNYYKFKQVGDFSSK